MNHRGTTRKQVPDTEVFRYGKFTFAVRGELALSDPNTVDSESLLGRLVTLHVAQLVRS